MSMRVKLSHEVKYVIDPAEDLILGTAVTLRKINLKVGLWFIISNISLNA